MQTIEPTLEWDPLRELKQSVRQDLVDRTDELVAQQVQLFRDIQDGRKLLRNLRIPYLQMRLPKFDAKSMLNEAMSIQNLFVSHRSSDSSGWKSLCLHGIDNGKTASFDAYGYSDEISVPYQWTEASTRCPMTTTWLRSLLENGYFTRFFRVRFMLLEPGGYIRFHHDRPHGMNSLGPLNIALNMPKDCHWLFREFGPVPFVDESAFCVDVSNDHGVWNNSNTPRFHIIIHGQYGPAYYDGLVQQKNFLAKRTQNPSKVAHKVSLAGRNSIGYGLWQYADGVESQDYFQKLRNLTLHFLRLRLPSVKPIIEDHSLNRIIAQSAEAGHEWCVIMTPGNMIKDGFFDAVEQTCKKSSPKTALIAHLLDRKERGFGIHHQFFIVRVSAWLQAGQPRAEFKAFRDLKLTNVVRSPENVHDDYTPLWLKAGVGEVTRRPRVLGWNWIESFLKAGFQIENVSPALRGKRQFLYPEQNSEAVSRFLSSISHFEQNLDSFQMSTHQKEVAKELCMEAGDHGKKLFLFNTEGIGDVKYQKNRKPVERVICVSAGFKDLHILHLHGVTASTQLIYFDVSPQALAFKKALFEEWDGQSYPDFIRRISAENREDLDGSVLTFNESEMDGKWQKEVALWDNPADFRNTFELAQKMKKTFVQLDILKEPGAIAKMLGEDGNGPTAIWFSNCFNYTPSLAQLNWDLHYLENAGREFMRSVQAASLETGREIYLYGEDPCRGARCQHLGTTAREYWT